MQPHTFFYLRASVCFGICESLQCVCSLPCCSVRDCRGYFIKVHLQACLRPNHPPSKSHLHQTLGTLRPFLPSTLYCSSLQWGWVKQQKHVSWGTLPFPLHRFSSKCRFDITAELNPNMIFPGTPPLYTPICVFSCHCGFDQQSAYLVFMFLVIEDIEFVLL